MVFKCTLYKIVYKNIFKVRGKYTSMPKNICKKLLHTEIGNIQAL